MDNSNKKNILISFIIPAYNAEMYIKRCIMSIINNYISSCCEILVIENGSTDQTSIIVSNLIKEYDMIKLLHSEKGVSNARNKGIEHAKGEWLFFIDADDRLLLMNHNIIEKCAYKNDSDLYVFGHKSGDRLIYKSEHDYELYNVDQIDNLMTKMLKNPTVYLTVWGKLLSRDIVIENEIRFDNDLKFAEDSHFVLQYMKCVKNACMVRDIVYEYSIDTPSVMRGNAISKYNEYEKSLTRSRQIFEKDDRQLRHAFSFYVIMHLNIVMVRTCFSVYNRQSLPKRINDLKRFCNTDIVNSALKDIKLTECSSIGMLPCLFVKMRCWLLAAFMFRVRAVQNFRRER